MAVMKCLQFKPVCCEEFVVSKNVMKTKECIRKIKGIVYHASPQPDDKMHRCNAYACVCVKVCACACVLTQGKKGIRGVVS